jgi:hypothetical protein
MMSDQARTTRWTGAAQAEAPGAPTATAATQWGKDNCRAGFSMPVIRWVIRWVSLTDESVL